MRLKEPKIVFLFIYNLDLKKIKQRDIKPDKYVYFFFMIKKN